ncbi:type II toxin-antitoxin system HicA family toxin [Desulfonatronovibrio magnus]|uniref:type II toxin-antitoxin system HicA family toxin n=1 Tax=Desulfonatronovibrio magnus TaxID=698827 RepID=UPI0005EB20C4
MTSHPVITFRDFIQRVEKLGFQKVRQKGSHIRYKHADGRMTTIPDHGAKDVPQGLLNKIVRHDLKLSMDHFFNQSE